MMLTLFIINTSVDTTSYYTTQKGKEKEGDLGEQRWQQRDQYFTKSEEYRVWLKLSKRRAFEEMDAKESHFK